MCVVAMVTINRRNTSRTSAMSDVGSEEFEEENNKLGVRKKNPNNF